MSNVITFTDNETQIIPTDSNMSAYVIYGRGDLDGGIGEIQFDGIAIENGIFTNGNFEHPVIAGQNAELKFNISGGGINVDFKISVFAWVTHK